MAGVWNGLRRHGAGCVLAALVGFGAPGCRPRPAPPLYFVQITDTHFGDVQNDLRVDRLVDIVNGLPYPIACVVVTGDIFSDNIEAKASQAKRTFARLRVPVHFLPGNHDIVAARVGSTLSAYRRNFGPVATNLEYQGVVFLTTYVEPLCAPIRVYGYDPLQWMEQALKHAGRKPVIVFEHTPAADDFYQNTVHESWTAESRAQWTRLLNRYHVKAVVAGHYHRDELYWLGDVPLYVSAPVAAYWGRQGSFRIYEYRNGRLSYRSVYLE